MTRSRLRCAVRSALAVGLAATAAATSAGCAGPAYNWAMFNHSPQELGVETRVTCSQHGKTIELLAGVLSPGDISQSDVAVRPLPDVVHVHWASGGVRHDADVAVHGRVPNEESFRDVLCLVVTDAGVALRPETEDELDEGQRLGRPAARP